MLLAVPGIFFLAGMGLQIPAGGLVLSFDENGAPQVQLGQMLVRLDLWPTWLEVGCVHAERAKAAGERLTLGLAEHDKFIIVTAELQDALVAMTAFAFTFDGFYDTLRHELGPHRDQDAWKRKRTARFAQMAETFRFRLKLGPTFSKQLRTVLKELLDFRNRAVHPTSRYVAPNYRPQLGAGVHPHLVTFSGPHAVQVRAVVLELLDRLVTRAIYLSDLDADKGWLDRGREELDRLSALYRVPGDDQLACPPAP